MPLSWFWIGSDGLDKTRSSYIVLGIRAIEIRDETLGEFSIEEASHAVRMLYQLKPYSTG